MTPTTPRHNLEELGRLGTDVFDRRVRPLLRPEDADKFVAVDVATGDFEVDEDDYTAVKRLHDRKPTAEVWLVRAGHAAAYKMRFGR